MHRTFLSVEYIFWYFFFNIKQCIVFWLHWRHHIRQFYIQTRSCNGHFPLGQFLNSHRLHACLQLCVMNPSKAWFTLGSCKHKNTLCQSRSQSPCYPCPVAERATIACVAGGLVGAKGKIRKRQSCESCPCRRAASVSQTYPVLTCTLLLFHVLIVSLLLCQFYHNFKGTLDIFSIGLIFL